MAWNIAYAIAGIILAGLTLRDVFYTVVVPGGSRASLQVTRRLGSLLLPLWKAMRGKRRGVSGTFAPAVLVGSFLIWLALLALAFGLMAYAARLSFQPAVGSLAEGIYIAGSSMMTVGPGKEDMAFGVARWIVLGAGFCGLAVMTMAVTYLLQVQNSITERDIGIIKLNTSAGNPPSAITLLQRFSAIRHRNALGEVLEEGRNWSATVRQSHAAHPSLIYFQSVGIGAGWPAALGTLLDLALVAEYLLADDDLYGPAVLLGDEGARMARELAQVSKLQPKDVSADPAALRRLAGLIADSGYEVRADPDFDGMARKRADYTECIEVLAEHLGKPTAPLIREG